MLSGEALIAIVNPRERRKMARRTPPRNSKGRFMKRGHAARRNPRRSARRHHASRARPARRRYTARRHHTTRRRRAHRNPRFAIPTGRMLSSTLGGALIGAGGALALDLALQATQQWQPAVVATPGIPRNLLRLGGAFLIGALSGLVVKPETRRAITAGAVTVVTYSIVKDLANQFVLPATMQLGEEPGGSYPWSWNPFLARLGHGGGGGSSGEQGVGRLRGYIGGPGIRSYGMPRVRAGAGATASRPLSSYIEDGVTSPHGSSLGADLEI